MPDVHPSKSKKPRRGNEIPFGIASTSSQKLSRSCCVSMIGCWEWQGHIVDKGYGLWHRPGAMGKHLRAHRVSWTLVHGPIKNGLTLDHLCRNRLCVNPAHLEAVSNSTNILRGESPTAANAKKTHCKYGHEFTKENTLLYRGRRNCWQCRKDKRKLTKNWRSGKHRPRVSTSLSSVS